MKNIVSIEGMSYIVAVVTLRYERVSRQFGFRRLRN